MTTVIASPADEQQALIVHDAVTVLRWCLACECDPETPAPADVSSFDWPAVIAVARRHHVTWALKPLVDAPWLDESVRTQLREMRRRAVLASLPVASTAIAVLGALSDAGIRCLTYKGVALAMATTGDAVARGVGDVDILVHPDDVPTAHRALIEMGAHAVTTDVPDASSPLWPMVRRLTCESPFILRDTPIDLHWRFDRLPQEVSIPFDTCWTRRQGVEIAGRLVQTLSPVDAFLVTCSHGTKEHWRHWRWIVDLVRQARMIDDWDHVRSSAHAYGCALSLDVALAIHQHLAPLPSGVTWEPSRRARALADQAWQESCQGSAPFGRSSATIRRRRLLWWIRTVPSVSAVGSVWVRQLWTTRDMVEVPLPLAMAWVYPLLRPLLVLRRVRAEKRAERKTGLAGHGREAVVKRHPD